MTASEELFNTVFDRTIRAWGVVDALRAAMAYGLDAYETESRRRLRAFVDAPDAGEYLDLTKLAAERLLEPMVEASGKHQRATATWGADAASVVFAHSAVDLAAMGYLRVTARAAPDDWRPWLDAKQVSLAAAIGEDPRKLVTTLLADHLDDLERQSLRKKTDRLHALCPPGESPFDPPFVFDVSIIDRFDRDRHDIVHRDRILKPFPTLPHDLEYLQKTTIYFMTLVNRRYGLKLNPAFLRDLPRQGTG